MAMKGKDRHMRRLRRLSEGGQRVANKVVVVGAELIRAEAHLSISRGSVSGKGHVASAPGEPPNRDTGHLQAHLTTTNPRPLLAEVRSEAEYAAALEFGTERMAERPYIRPARDAKKRDIDRLFQTEMGHMIQRSGR